MRTVLIDELGVEKGSEVAEQLVIDAMPISAPNPSMVDMRTAIIAADVIRYTGDHYDTLWKAFAQRGLGYGASSQGGNDTNPHPGFDHPDENFNGHLIGKVVNADTNKPIPNINILVSDFEARISPAATTSEQGLFSLPMVEDTYEITIQAKGYGSRTLEDVTITAGNNNEMTIALEPNLASSANGAEIDSVSSELSSNPVENMIDDTEASVYASQQSEGEFTGAEVVIDLAGDKPKTVSTIQVSAFKDIAKSRFSALKDFTIQASKDGQTWTQIAEGTFETMDPRPTAPALHYKSFEATEKVKANYIKVIAEHAQDDSKGYVQIADVQIFSDKKVGIEPLVVEPTEPFTAEGTIQVGNAGTGVGQLAGVPATLAVTQNEFITTQNPEPASQGVDGYVNTIPKEFSDVYTQLKLLDQERAPMTSTYSFTTRTSSY